MREKVLKIITFSTDSAPQIFSAGKRMMTPTDYDIKNGVLYLGLGLEDELYLTPYYWQYPSIYIPDPDHLLRLFLRGMKNENHTLMFCNGISNHIKMRDLSELHFVCTSVDMNITLGDLALVKFHDQNTSAAHNIFQDKIADLLGKYIPQSGGTVLYILAVSHLMKPYFSLELKSYSEVMTSIATGIYILRFWKRYLELNNQSLQPKTGNASYTKCKGKFITKTNYYASEPLYSGTIGYLLTLLVHFKDKLSHWCCPVNTGTLTTERMISQILGKNNHLQSLDAQPTYVNILERLNQVQENQQAEEELTQLDYHIPESNYQRKLHRQYHKHCEVMENENISIPDNLEEFKTELKQSIENGKDKAKQLINQCLPSIFMQRLQKESVLGKTAADLPCIHDKRPSNLILIDAPLQKTLINWI